MALDQHAVDERIRLEAYTAAVLTALTPGPGPAQPHRAGLHSVLPAYSARLHAPQVIRQCLHMLCLNICVAR